MTNDTCIAVDSACDLPYKYIDDNKIKVLPINLRLDGKVFRDIRDPMRTIQLYNSRRLHKQFSAMSEPVSVEEISDLIEHELALQYDNIIAITISSKRSDVYKNVRESVFIGTEKFKSARTLQGRTQPLRIRIIDSAALFPGQGLLAYEANHLISEMKVPLNDAVVRLESIKHNVRGYLLPESLYYLKNRANAKGEKSIGLLNYSIGGLLNIKPIIEAHKGETSLVDKAKGFRDGLQRLFSRATDAIRSGLCINAINMSYAGNPSAIEQLPEYQAFLQETRKHNVNTLMSVMSTTAAINVGPGAFSLAFAEQ